MGLDENIFADHKNSFPARKITRIACRSLEFGPWGTIDGHIRGDTAGRSIVAKIDRMDTVNTRPKLGIEAGLASTEQKHRSHLYVSLHEHD